MLDWMGQQLAGFLPPVPKSGLVAALLKVLGFPQFPKRE
jgi:hypothetical protein